MAEDDPFACFDSSDDESDVDVTQQQGIIKRDSSNGVLAFHAGTEVALLHHLRQELANCTESEMDRPSRVLEMVDNYCLSRHWMMHVGPEKADPLRRFIGDALQEHKTSKPGKPFQIVELGTYCGYSSVFIAKTVLEHCRENDYDNSFHIYSVEVVEKFAQVARELIQLAGMEDYVSVILVKDAEEIAAARRRGEGDDLSLSFQLKRHMQDTFQEIDFLFVDHDKSLYLPNLQELEQEGMIRKGTHVAADNVIFAQIQDYRDYMANLANQGIVSTRLEKNLFVEYCQPELEETNETNAAQKDMMRDGIEFSIYLQDPIEL